MINILAIDRDQATLAHIRLLCERAGFRTLCTSDAETGLQLAKSTTPYLVIADIRIAAKDGIEVVKELQRRVPSAKVVGLSGSALLHAEEFEAVVNQLGIERLLAKPIDDSLLLQAVFDLVPRQKPSTQYSATRNPLPTTPVSQQFYHFAPMLASH